jgi:hypothetical protein
MLTPIAMITAELTVGWQHAGLPGGTWCPNQTTLSDQTDPLKVWGEITAEDQCAKET